MSHQKPHEIVEKCCLSEGSKSREHHCCGDDCNQERHHDEIEAANGVTFCLVVVWDQARKQDIPTHAYHAICDEEGWYQ
jgi:hypothetical protein